MNNKWKQASVDILKLEPSEINANEMSEKEFKRLVENIRISGGLSSAIGCYKKKDSDKYVIFSGHHRYKAALELRYTEVPVIYADEADLSNDEILALQLSHNSLHGDDNKNILKKMFAEIQSIEFKDMAYIDMSEVAPIDTTGVSFSMESEHYSLSLILYKKDLQNLESLLGLVNEAKEKHDIVILADGANDNEEDFLKLLTEIRKKYQVRALNVAFSKFLELANNQMQVE